MIGPVTMINVCLVSAPFINTPAQKMGEFLVHHRRQILPNRFSNVHPKHLKKLFWLLLNLLENLRYFRYCHFQLHGAFSFNVWFMGINPLKGKAPFFLLLHDFSNLHKIYYTTTLEQQDSLSELAEQFVLC